MHLALTKKFRLRVTSSKKAIARIRAQTALKNRINPDIRNFFVILNICKDRQSFTRVQSKLGMRIKERKNLETRKG